MHKIAQNNMTLNDVERAFSDLFAGQPDPFGAALRGTPIGASRGITTYKTTATAALQEAVKATYKTCEQILGSDYFNQCVAAFVSGTPMQGNDLNLYGSEFPAFLAILVKTRTELSALTYLADLAQLEAARNHAFYAGKRSEFNFMAFASLSEREHEQISFRLSPDLSLLPANSNVRELFEFHNHADNITNDAVFTLIEGDYYYAVRRATPDADVCIALDELDEYTFNLLSSIKTGESFSRLCDKFSTEQAGKIEAPPIGRLIAQGFIDGFVKGKKSEPAMKDE